MKLRVRLRKKTQPITLEDDQLSPTLADLKGAVLSTFQIEQFEVSLDGKKALEGDDSTILKDLGLVSGDLVHILSNETSAQVDDAPPPHVSNENPQPSTSTGASNAKSVAEDCRIDSSKNESGKEDEKRDEESATQMEAQSASGAEQSSEANMEMDLDDQEAIMDCEVNKYLKEPLLVRESTNEAVPQNLVTVYNESEVNNPHDAVTLVLHVLMMETGYQLVDNESELPMPAKWWKSGSFQLKYTNHSCPEVEFRLLVAPFGSVLMIHGMVEKSNTIIQCQLQLRPTDYVCNIETEAHSTYRFLPKLSLAFKDNIAYPMLQRAQQDMGQVSFGLLGLVLELKISVLKHLDVVSLLKMSEVCKEFHEVTKRPELWRNLYLRTFGRRTNSELSQDWQKFYREKYCARKQMQRQMRHMRVVVPPYMNPSPAPPGPFGPIYPPGIIGGDYDLFPGVPLPGRGVPRPRFDPYGPVPYPGFRPGRGGGMMDPRGPFGFGPSGFF